MKKNKNSKRRQKKKRQQHHKQKRNVGVKDPVAQSLTDRFNDLPDELESATTGKDKILVKWLVKREAEIRKAHGSTDASLFLNASMAVSELERLYDAIEMAVMKYFSNVDIDDFFRNIRMYTGKNVSDIYTYLTDWKTLMYTIYGEIPEHGIFPTLGLHYDLVASPRGYLGIKIKNGNMIAIIPVLPGAEKPDGSIYPQHGEPLVNGNLEHSWEKWYELNRLIDNEKDCFKLLKYFDEIFEYTLSNNLFNKKKINIAKAS